MTKFLNGLSFARVARIAIVAFLLLAGTDIALRVAREFFFPFGKARNTSGRSDFTEYCNDFLPRKRGTRPRILLIGDSTLLGLNRRYDETFSYFLSRSIEEVPALKGAQIINLALGNATPADSYLIAQMFRDFEADLVLFPVNRQMYGPAMKNYLAYPEFLRRQRPEVLADEDIKAASRHYGRFDYAKRAFNGFAQQVWFLGRMRYLLKRWWVEEDMTARLAKKFGITPRIHKSDPSWRVRTETGGMMVIEWYIGMKYTETLKAGPEHSQYRFVTKCARTFKNNWSHAIVYANPVCYDIYEFANPGGNWRDIAVETTLKMQDAIREGGLTPYDYTHAVKNNEYFADQDHLLADGNRVFAEAVAADLKKIFSSGRAESGK